MKYLTATSSIRKLFLSLTLVATHFCISSVYADSLDYKETKDMSIDASDLSLLDIDVGAGFLEIIGDDKLSQIEVTAKIQAHDEDEIELSLTTHGNRAKLVADIDHRMQINWGSDDSPRIDLTVRIPTSLELNIKDGSGKISIENIKTNIEIKDGSGSLEVSDVEGNLDINDGSGSIVITDIKGDLLIDDGSGSMTIEKITGKVTIEDGSGSMMLEDIGGLVTIDDGSGSIKLNNLSQGLTIIEEGSGGLKMSNIEGPVSIK